MDKEILALESNKTWELTQLPLGKKTVECKWVYKIKHNQDGTVERYKARLVAKGYTQTLGLDYIGTFSHVAKLTTIRTRQDVTTIKEWHLHRLDINNAFLHGDLDEEVYMDLLPGIQYTALGQVCRLRKSLYGLKQASRQWNIKLTANLVSQGFTQAGSDHSLFTKGTGDFFIVLLVYVDDILLASMNEAQIQQVKHHLHTTFQIKDMGPAKFFLRLEIARSKVGINLSK